MLLKMDGDHKDYVLVLKLFNEAAWHKTVKLP